MLFCHPLVLCCLTHPRFSRTLSVQSWDYKTGGAPTMFEIIFRPEKLYSWFQIFKTSRRQNSFLSRQPNDSVVLKPSLKQIIKKILFRMADKTIEVVFSNSVDSFSRSISFSKSALSSAFEKKFLILVFRDSPVHAAVHRFCVFNLSVCWASQNQLPLERLTICRHIFMFSFHFILFKIGALGKIEIRNEGDFSGYLERSSTLATRQLHVCVPFSWTSQESFEQAASSHDAELTCDEPDPEWINFLLHSAETIFACFSNADCNIKCRSKKIVV